MAESKIKPVKDRGPEERLAWRRALLKRKNERKRDHNRVAKSRIANIKRTLRKALAAGDQESSAQSLVKFYAALDKAAKNGVIHARTAARRKSRAAKNLARLAA
ncbi:MAG: 30S ribosomal protein S20 [Verrucomicrobiales bacterium]|nr:30S ribosomal protein S20 [Verrucomicrobiales bacterium]|tara:strand:+ start:709 stop:1020 length:312 start_codon:yes stop_codon:yes gene_type:complete